MTPQVRFYGKQLFIFQDYIKKRIPQTKSCFSFCSLETGSKIIGWFHSVRFFMETILQYLNNVLAAVKTISFGAILH